MSVRPLGPRHPRADRSMPRVAVAPNALGEGRAPNGSPRNHCATDIGGAETLKRGTARASAVWRPPYC